MKGSTILFGAIAQLASAHYFFDTNIVDGKVQPAYKYVRESSRATKYNPIKFSSNPAADIRDGSHVDGPDIVCNQGGDKAGRTEVLTVSARSEVRLRLGNSETLFHPGPGLVYMSKAPGSGDGGGSGGGGGSGCAGEWEQCGGNGWDGPTCCFSGSC